jgi:hypothetical protein
MTRVPTRCFSLMIAAMALIVTVALARTFGSGPFDLTWNTIDGGGGASSGGGAGGFQLAGTIGQPDAGGSLSGGAFTLVGGFWPGVGEANPSCEGDADNSGAVDVDDLIAVILGWGGCANCPPIHCASDVAPFPGGNCATDVDDLVSVILHWGACP